MSMLFESTVDDRKSPGSEPLFHIFVLSERVSRSCMEQHIIKPFEGGQFRYISYLL